MNLPRQLPGLYAMVFLLWGAAGGEWAIAVAAAAALELPRLFRRTFDVDERTHRMAWLLSLLLVWMLAINGWLEYGRVDAVRGILKWIPLAVMPMALASAVATVPGIPVSSLLLLLRHRYLRASMGGVVPVVPRVDPFLPYLWVTLLSASYQHPGRWFLPASAMLVAAVVAGTARRTRRLREAVVCAALAGLAAVVLQAGILNLYRVIEAAVYGRLQGTSAQEVNRTMTRIGSVDEIKSRQDILWWVRHDSGPSPGYLYEATYDAFSPNYSLWSNSDRLMNRFEGVLPMEAGSPPKRWDLGGLNDPAGRCRVRGYPTGEMTVLPLPEGTTVIEDLPAFRLERNGLGVVRTDCAEPVLDFAAVTGSKDIMRPLPDAGRDLRLNTASRELVAQVVRELGLEGLPPRQAAARIAAFFARDFTYTRKIHMAGVKEFLTQTHRGHCEFFATSSVLLLRAAGIPARYHTGFALVEFDAEKRSWRVRGSHAHAWASAWLDGRWEVVDNTPPDWTGMEGYQPGWFQRAADWWKETLMAFQEWRAARGNNPFMAWFAPVTAALAVLYTALRLAIGRKKKHKENPGDEASWDYPVWDGSSPWMDILPEVERLAGTRPPELPTLLWLGRLDTWPDEAREDARALAAAHNQERFGMGSERQARGDAAAVPARFLRFLRGGVLGLLAGIMLALPGTAEADDAIPWLRAEAPRPFAFPRDHFSHPGFKTEWWYFTGNLETGSGERLGFQFTLFRNGIRPPGGADPASRWVARDIGLGHAALSLPVRREFLFGQVLERGSLGGAVFPEADAGNPAGLLARVADWRVEMGGDGGFRFSAAIDGGSLALAARPLVPPVLQGEDGFSRKAAGPGNASYYFSIPRLETTGTVTIRGKSETVRGLAWLDREWASNQLAPEQTGWDWFAIQFDDGRDLMLYRMRRSDGSRDPFSHGTLRLPDGNTRRIGAGDFSLMPGRHWKSPRTGGVYPVAWKLAIPGERLDLEITTTQDNQELPLEPVAYYEGAISVSAPAGRVCGRGYLEMTGYARPMKVLGGGF